jgi:hypothetical protein
MLFPHKSISLHTGKNVNTMRMANDIFLHSYITQVRRVLVNPYVMLKNLIQRLTQRRITPYHHLYALGLFDYRLKPVQLVMACYDTICSIFASYNFEPCVQRCFTDQAIVMTCLRKRLASPHSMSTHVAVGTVSS